MALTDQTRAEMMDLAARYPQARSALLPMLHLVQSEEGYVTEGGIIMCAEVLGLTTAEVVFVGDPKCRVAVVVRETSEHGVLSSSSVGVLDHRLMDLTHLPRHTALKPGQRVFTSGLGGVFPAGLPVGTIVDYRSVGYGLYTEARVKLSADTSRLNEVLVLFP